VILHSITNYAVVKPVADNTTRFVGTFGTEEHKRFIHKRVLENCVWEEGLSCTVGTDLGIVVHVYKEEEYENVHWRELECKCVEVFLYSASDTVMCHPNQLRTR